MRYIVIFLLASIDFAHGGLLSANLDLKLKDLIWIGQRKEERHNIYNGCNFGAGSTEEHLSKSSHKILKKCKTLTCNNSFIVTGTLFMGLLYANHWAYNFLHDPSQLHYRDASMIINIETMYAQLFPGQNPPEDLFSQLIYIANEIHVQTKYCDQICKIAFVLRMVPIEYIQKKGINLLKEAQAAKQRLIQITKKISDLFSYRAATLHI